MNSEVMGSLNLAELHELPQYSSGIVLDES
jgi:hypothetical protein